MDETCPRCGAINWAVIDDDCDECASCGWRDRHG